MNENEYSESEKLLFAELEAVEQAFDEIELNVAKRQANLDKAKQREAQILKQLNIVRDDISKYTRLVSDVGFEKLQLEDKKKKILAEIEKVKSKRLSETDAKETREWLEAEFGETKWWQNMLDFQKEDLIFTTLAWDYGRSGILNSNVMGAGKTLEQRAFQSVVKKKFTDRFSWEPKMLWITKKSLRESSKEELLKWNTPGLDEMTYLVVEGDKKTRGDMAKLGVQFGSVVIINYDGVRTTPGIFDIDWDIIFIDEVHQLKGGANQSGPTQRFTSVRNLMKIRPIDEHGRRWTRVRVEQTKTGESTKQLPFVSMLSATPIQNRPQEVWCWLHLFEPERFPTLRQFEHKYVETYKGFQPLELLKTLQGKFIRQDPELIYSQRPEKDRIIVPVELTPKQQKVYDRIRNYTLAGFESDPNKMKSINAVIAQLTRLRQCVLYPAGIQINGDRIKVEESGKLDEAMEIIDGLTSDSEQVVVWSAQFNDVLFELGGRCQLEGLTVEYITGKTQNPGEVEKRFQNGEIDVLLCNMTAAGEGYNFNKSPNWEGGASNAVFLDRHYNPQKNFQAEDRIWRTGVTHGVKIWILHGLGTVDNLIQEINRQKMEVFDQVIEAEALRPDSVDWSDVLEDLI